MPLQKTIEITENLRFISQKVICIDFLKKSALKSLRKPLNFRYRSLGADLASRSAPNFADYFLEAEALPFAVLTTAFSPVGRVTNSASTQPFAVQTFPMDSRQ